MKTVFETIECSRCRGSGKYSFCEEYRDVCFKCSGNGVVLSTRGLMAQKLFTELCSIQFKDVVVGDLVRVGGITSNMKQYSYIAKVVEINTSPYLTTSCIGDIRKSFYPLMIVTENLKHGKLVLHGEAEVSIRVFRDDDKVKLNRALEYQNSLTKSGKERVRK
jgi:hypothetical protein